MNQFKHTFRSKISFFTIGIIILFQFLSSCNIVRHVPEGKMLLKKNELTVEPEGNVDETQLTEIIKQQPNIKFANFWRLRLRVFNMVRESKAQKSHQKRFRKKVYKKNQKITAKEKQINDKRIKNAQKKADKDKTPKATAKRNKKNARRTDKIERRFLKKWAKDSIPEIGTPPEKDSISKLNLRSKALIKQRKAYKLERRIIRPKTTYIQKSLAYKLRDSVNIGLSFRERLKYKFGEAPVIIDTAKLDGTLVELKKYMTSKGYFDATVIGTVIPYLKKRRGEVSSKKKGYIDYRIQTGARRYFDTVLFVNETNGPQGDYMKYLRKIEDKAGLNAMFYGSIKDKKTVNIPFDADALNQHRFLAAKYLRDKSYYGFTENNISYVVDSTNRKPGDFGMKLTIKLLKRQVIKGGQKDPILVDHISAQVVGVHFIIADTSMYVGNFYDSLQQSTGYPDKEMYKALYQDKFLITQDTLSFTWLIDKVQNSVASEKEGKIMFFKSTIHNSLFGKPKDSINFDPFRQADFYYNGDLFVRPELLEAQNYLEKTNTYKEYYLDRSYTRLTQLNLFSVIKPVIKETYPGSGKLIVNYFLVPSVRQGFSFEPKATNSSGFLGVSASISYFNKNVFKASSRITTFHTDGTSSLAKRKFRSGTSFTFSFSGGLESNPIVFDESTTGNVAGNTSSLNTIEAGPSIKFEIPGLFPVRFTALKNKRQRPKTIISAGYNFQKRPEFSRQVAQFNFGYKFAIGNGKTQNITCGFPGISTLKFVNIQKTDDFSNRINATGNLFLRNQYSDQFIWEGFRASYEFDNLEKDPKIIRIRNYRTIASLGFISAGGIAELISNIDPKVDQFDHPTLLGIPFSRFYSFDSKWITTFSVLKKSTIAFKVLGSLGLPNKKNSAAMPYDYSFFGGGANDNRGWIARSLGPGSYNSLLDSNAIQNQIADIRLASSLEIRLGQGFINHAFFVDAGNIWTKNEDPARPGAKFSANWWKEIGLTVGYGLRVDLSFFIIRLDIGIPIYKPSFFEGERWIFTPKNQLDNLIPLNERPNVWHAPQIQFGIGLPF